MYWLISTIILLFFVLFGWLKTDGGWLDLAKFGGFFIICVIIRYVLYRIRIANLEKYRQKLEYSMYMLKSRAEEIVTEMDYIKNQMEGKSSFISSMGGIANTVSQLLGHPWIGWGLDILSSSFLPNLFNKKERKQLEALQYELGSVVQEYQNLENNYNSIPDRYETELSMFVWYLIVMLTTIIAVYILCRFEYDLIILNKIRGIYEE